MRVMQLACSAASNQHVYPLRIYEFGDRVSAHPLIWRWECHKIGNATGTRRPAECAEQPPAQSTPLRGQGHTAVRG